MPPSPPLNSRHPFISALPLVARVVTARHRTTKVLLDWRSRRAGYSGWMRTPDYPAADAVRWAAVDGYFAELLTPDDASLAGVLKANAAAGLPAHDVSAPQGQLLALLIQMTAASRVLEIGTLGGYSTIRMARSLPVGGTVVTIEADPDRAEVARVNMMRAGVFERIDLRVGPALDVLPTLAAPFDFIFIDADKPNNPAYLSHALACHAAAR